MFSAINRMKLNKMSRSVFSGLVCCLLLVDFHGAIAQPDHFAYAMTATQKGGTEWIALRKLDTRTGEFSPLLFSVQDNKGVAAIAYDRRDIRLFYTPMNLDQLRY